MLGVLVVGGVAYFAIKSSVSPNTINDNSNYYPSVSENQNNNTNTSIKNPPVEDYLDLTKAILIIKEDSIPNHAQDFSFLVKVKGVSSEPGVSSYSQNFILDDDQTGVTTNVKTLRLVPGTYSIFETQVVNWTTTISCTPGFEGGTDFSNGNTNSVDIGAGKTVTCIYTNTSNVTANWKTYTNNALKLSLKYPTTWSVDTSHENSIPVPQVSFYPPNPKENGGFTEIYLSISNNTAQPPYDGFSSFDQIKEHYAQLEKEPLANYKFSFQETTIGGLKALIVLRSDLPKYKTIYFFRNGIDYTIETGQYNTEDINAILATIKFTD